MNGLRSITTKNNERGPGHNDMRGRFHTEKSSGTELMNAICSARYVSGIIVKFANDTLVNAVVSSCMIF